MTTRLEEAEDEEEGPPHAAGGSGAVGGGTAAAASKLARLAAMAAWQSCLNDISTTPAPPARYKVCLRGPELEQPSRMVPDSPSRGSPSR
eukprot:6465603-Amphidinium_carterae.1